METSNRIFITKSKILIEDNAAGINRQDCDRAFKAGAAPDEKDKGLSEFGRNENKQLPYGFQNHLKFKVLL